MVFLRCKGYSIRYSRSRFLFIPSLIYQIPKILFAIRRERKWLAHIITEYGIDAVISDNRFGLHSKKIPCVYITHQLCIKAKFLFTEKLLQKIHYHFIKKFSCCWVPDSEKNSLAGRLSHPGKIPANTVYTGPLSRFSRHNATPLYDLLIMISGPEPQRTLFEEKLLKELATFKGSAYFVRGLPHNADEINSLNGSVTIVNHMDAGELNKKVEEAFFIISRSGYTTVMDLAALQKKAILIPTPGQTEQEYLAAYLQQEKYFYTTSQESFSLEADLQKAKDFAFTPYEEDFNEYKTRIKEWVQSLKQKTASPAQLT